MPGIVPRTQVAQRDFSTFQVPCGNVGCKRFFKTTAGRTKHILSAHPIVSPPASPEPHISHPNDIADNPFQDDELLGQLTGDNEALRASPPPNVHAEFYGPGNLLYRNYHTLLDGRPCDKHGHFLPEGTPPPPPEPKSPNNWTPFRNRAEFETAEYFYIQNQTPAGQVDHLLDLWATTLLKSGGSPPFADHKDLYATIDSITLGDMKWEGFSCKYTGKKPDGYPPWMDGTYDVWYRDPREVVLNMLANLSYSNEMDYQPYHDKCSILSPLPLFLFLALDYRNSPFFIPYSPSHYTTRILPSSSPHLAPDYQNSPFFIPSLFLAPDYQNSPFFIPSLFLAPDYQNSPFFIPSLFLAPDYQNPPFFIPSLFLAPDYQNSPFFIPSLFLAPDYQNSTFFIPFTLFGPKLLKFGVLKHI
ncbi:hypothetical protein F4604DRAFT_1916128 [Suillus subluteus]|nr:hypothetical protein F4604DRAFT_1916128 [Suillus subluteus]